MARLNAGCEGNGGGRMTVGVWAEATRDVFDLGAGDGRESGLWDLDLVVDVVGLLQVGSWIKESGDQGKGLAWS